MTPLGFRYNKTHRLNHNVIALCNFALGKSKVFQNLPEKFSFQNIIKKTERNRGTKVHEHVNFKY